MNKLSLLPVFIVFYLTLANSPATAQQAAVKQNQPPALKEDLLTKVKEEESIIDAGGVKIKTFAAYIPDSHRKLPVILVVPEWWGYGDFVKMRARKLATLGFFALAVDMYGEGKQANSVNEAQKLSGVFYKDPKLAVSRLEAAERKARSHPQADPTRVGAIGYCFGGSMVLNAAKLGMDFKAVVSFHGGLSTEVPAVKGKVAAHLLICHGAADKFVSKEELISFRKNLDSAGVDYTFKVYPNATHAFTNPDATVNGKKFNLPIAYNADADKRSWEDMKFFLKSIFGGSL